MAGLRAMIVQIRPIRPANQGRGIAGLGGHVLRRLLRIALLLGAVLAPCAQAVAAGRGVVPVQAQGLRAACMDDYLRLCRGTPMRRGRVILCLNRHADQLSQGCFQALTIRGLAFAAALKACRPDFERFCGGAPLNMRRTLICLQQNADALSPACRKALTDDDDDFDAPQGPGGRP
jgi:hypothetical protein